MSAFADVFTPFKVVSRKVFVTMVVIQIIVFLCIWIFMSPVLIPRPHEILGAFDDLWRQGMLAELIVSFKTNVKALAMAVAISLGLSYLTVTPFWRPIATIMGKMRFLGLTGLTLIFTLTVGGGMKLKLSLLVWGITAYYVTNMMAVVAEIPQAEYDHARTLRYSKWRTVWEVVIRGKLDQAFEVTRQNAAIGWAMVAMVEGMVRSGGGIGGMLLTQNRFLDLSAVFAIQFLILVLGLGQDTVLGILKRVVCPWANLRLERR